MEITAFDKDITSEFSKMNKTSSFNAQIPSSMTYHIINAFPTNIVAAPLAYGRAELIKTTITFAYEQYHTSRTSRKGSQLEESDAKEIRGLNANEAEVQALMDDTGRSRIDAQIIASGGFAETVIE